MTKPNETKVVERKLIYADIANRQLVHTCGTCIDWTIPTNISEEDCLAILKMAEDFKAEVLAHEDK